MEQKIRQDISIGGNIRKFRISCHLTQEAIVAQLQLHGCDISRSAFSQIECGTYNIRVSELLALADILHREPGDFFKNL